jgi:hypothetical protein
VTLQEFLSLHAVNYLTVFSKRVVFVSARDVDCHRNNCEKKETDGLLMARSLLRGPALSMEPLVHSVGVQCCFIKEAYD